VFTPNPHQTGRLIVIDDEPAVRKVVKKFLERLGHYVEEAATGEEALSKISNGNFDIVITDIKLPKMDGMAVLDKIKEIKSEIEVIVVTGYGSIESAVSFMKAGALDYISKPINTDHLEIIIEKALERKELIIAARERDIYLKMSLTDALTGLFNHKYFMDHLEREIQSSRRSGIDLSIMMLDIDDFKKVNDSFGHQTGDKVLQYLSSDIIRACRTHDTVARYGGEEFGIILPNTDIVKSEAVAQRILTIISSQVYKPLHAPITVSIGISGFPRHANERDDLIQRADMALYRSKESGKNRYTVYDSRFGAGD